MRNTTTVCENITHKSINWCPYRMENVWNVLRRLRSVSVTRSAAVTYSVTREMLCGWTELVRSTADQGPVIGMDSVSMTVKSHGMSLWEFVSKVDETYGHNSI